ncbi:hypothetical protein FHT44_006151 [Mycolicibacterium sp. BK634]|uniref:hypothetical protein n=1 Tax=Mycolicibacterium sp. BK634 TaxID=2587099 RepID=UPI00161A53E1|nr:hypothetical protein [Mycolicibacterium sp. BK634]MBB3753629.1 hypothetical protein [Mycolicibacterium sp. BK634]
MSTRRGPWLSGLVFAVLGAVWLIVQVVGGVVSWIEGIVDGAGVVVTNTDVSPDHRLASWVDEQPKESGEAEAGLLR